MDEITLRTYISEIEDLIEHNQLEEAIAHCRHILSTFPKHLETYRLLGKSLLEQGRHSDAADIFQRVLSVVPDDFVSHVGMAIIREDETNLDGAIWHMERAFEVMSSNNVIQEELRRLYGRRDGLEPSRIRYTRGALARTYAKGGLYPQAIAELQAGLSDEPDRLDLRVLYADVLWRNNQKIEAAETCAAILEQLPYCREANHIMAAIWTSSGEAAEAGVHRARVEAIDPYAAFADKPTDGDGATSVPAQIIRLPKLQWSPQVEGQRASGGPEWMSALGISFAQPAAESAVPDWLAEAVESPATGAPTEGNELPDWLAEMTPAAEPSAPADTDWLTSLRSEAAVAEAAAPAAASVPEWMIGLEPASPAVTTGSTPAGVAGSAEDEAPEWLREPVISTGASAAAAPEWLSAIEGARAEKTSLPSPDGLTAGESEPPVEPSAKAKAPQDATLPGWLRNTDWKPLSQSGAGAAPDRADQGGVPDWLSADAGPEAQREPVAHLSERLQPVAQIPADSTGGLPDWLAPGGIPTPEAEDSLPEWLRASSEPEYGPGSAQMPAAEPAAEKDIPEWVKALAPSPDVEATTSEEFALPITRPQVEVPTFLQDKQPGASDTISVWLNRRGTETPAEKAPISPPEPADDMPAWLREALAAEGTSTPGPQQYEASPATPGRRGGTAPFSTDIGQFDQPPPPTPAYFEAAHDEPEVWVAPEPSPELPTKSAQAAASATPAKEMGVADETRVWLDSLAAMHDAHEEETVTRPEARGTEMPSLPRETPATIETAASHVEAPVGPAVRPAESLADWPQTAQVTPPETSEPPAAAADLSADEALAWLETLAARHAMKEEATTTRPPARSQTLPSWLREGLDSTPAEESAEEEATTGRPPARSEDIPSWLREGRDATLAEEPVNADATAARPQARSEEIPSWLREGLDATPAEEPAVAAPAEPEARATDAVPDQLPTGGAEPAAPVSPIAGSGDDEAWAWLESLAAKHGAKEEELFTRPEARTEGLPSWLRETPEAAPLEETAAAVPAQPEAQQAKPLPDWLLASRALATPPVSPAEGPTQAAPAEPPAPAVPVAESEDEALAWLESLAAKQGAAEEELIKRPEARPEARIEEMPAWLREGVPGPSESAAEPVAAAPAEPLTDWLQSTLAAAPPEPPAPAPAEPAISEDEALGWLESLAARQGAAEEELVTRPEARSEKIPAWLREDLAGAGEPSEEPIAAAPAEPAAQPTQAVPDWLLTPEMTEHEPSAAVPAEGEALAWLEALAAKHGAAEEELIARPEARPEEMPAWLLEGLPGTSEPAEASRPPAEAVPQWLQAAPEPEPERPSWLTAFAEPAAVPAETPAPEMAEPPSWPIDVWPPEAIETPLPAAAAPIERVGRPQPRPKAPRPTRKTGWEAEPPQARLEAARMRMQEGRTSEALTLYDSLIKGSHELDTVIADLEAAAEERDGRTLLRALGDAYARQNRLQQALDTYRLALGQHS